MTTRTDIEKNQNFSLATDFELPDCSVQDVDEAVFNLFDKQLPLFYKQKDDTKRVPIIFATGERFALLARKKPLRDRSKALILPIISIMRKSFQVADDLGMGTNMQVPQIIKKKLSPTDPEYQNIINKLGLKNADNVVSDAAFIDPVNLVGSMPGRVATRRNTPRTSYELASGKILSSDISNNIIDVYEMPPPIFITVEYDVTMWAQYLQHMNKLQSAILSEANIFNPPSFRIESAKKGYSFVLILDKSFSNDTNAEDFSEDERLIRSSFTMKATGYILGECYIGASNKVKHFVSAPQISFETNIVDAQPYETSRVPVKTGDPQTIILDDIRTDDESAPAQAIGGVISAGFDGENQMVGGQTNSVNEKYVRNINDPFIKGKINKNITVVKTSSTRSGETVFREIR